MAVGFLTEKYVNGNLTIEAEYRHELEAFVFMLYQNGKSQRGYEDR